MFFSRMITITTSMFTEAGDLGFGKQILIENKQARMWAFFEVEPLWEWKRGKLFSEKITVYPITAGFRIIYYTGNKLVIKDKQTRV